MLLPAFNLYGTGFTKCYISYVPLKIETVFCFVSWCVIILDESIKIVSICSFKRMHIISNNAQMRGPNVCKENIPHIISPPLPAWAVDTRPRHLCALYRAEIKIYPDTFFQSSTASAFCSWLTKVEPDVVFRRCSLMCCAF